MKNLLKSLWFLTIILSFSACSNEPVEDLELSIEASPQDIACSGDLPKARITNNGTIDVDLEIYNSSGVLVNHAYGVGPSQVSTWRVFSSDIVTFVISTANSVKEIRIDMGTCMAYDVTIDANHQLDTDQPIQL